MLAARLRSAGEVEDRAHALTGGANGAVARLMDGDEILAFTFGGFGEEVKQPISLRQSLLRI